MHFPPALPRDPAARLRLLCLWFVLFAVFIATVEVSIGGKAPLPARLAGVAAIIALAVWEIRGYRKGRFPEWSTPVEAVLLVIVTTGSSMPLRAMGLFLATIQLRSLYVSRREFWLLPVSFTIARMVGLALATDPPYGPLSATVIMQSIGLTIICGILFMLMLALDRHATTEKALARSEERYRVLAAAAHDMVYDWNLTTNTVTYSDAIRTVFGFAVEDVHPYRSWWVGRVHPKDRLEYYKVITELPQSESGVRTGIRYRIRRGDGSERTVVETAVLQRGLSGEPVGIVSSVRDVTAERRLEERLRDAQKMQAVGQLAGGVAHDFNNLLTVIGGHVFMLEQSGELPPAANRHLDGIRNTAERAGSLTRQLLAFGRKQLLHPTIVDLNLVVRDATRLIAPAVGDRIRIITSLSETPLPVLADGGQLEQVLLNLGLNARDAMPNGGTLRITTAAGESDEAPTASITFADTGVGMSPETMGHVFEPFFTTKTSGRGTGLGLATAYGIIKQSSGDIVVESKVGEGTTFTITLPLAKRPMNLVPGTSPVSHVHASGSQGLGVNRVLLVEDDDGVREFAREVLARSGATVFTATDGADGIAVAEKAGYDFDLVVTDVVMPELTGPEMMARLRRHRPGLRVLFITGYADDAVSKEALRAGHESLLDKPFSARGLRDAIRDLASNPAGGQARVTAGG